MTTLYRVQDKDGRGPFKPGFSHMWVAARGNSLPPIYDELGISPVNLREIIPVGVHAGCACKSMDDLRKWFRRDELRRLSKFGYEIVPFSPDMVIAETDTQVLFGMRTPLCFLRSVAA